MTAAVEFAAGGWTRLPLPTPVVVICLGGCEHGDLNCAMAGDEAAGTLDLPRDRVGNAGFKSEESVTMRTAKARRERQAPDAPPGSSVGLSEQAVQSNINRRIDWPERAGLKVHVAAEITAGAASAEV